jgi:hypothetical protein
MRKTAVVAALMVLSAGSYASAGETDGLIHAISSAQAIIAVGGTRDAINQASVSIYTEYMYLKNKGYKISDEPFVNLRVGFSSFLSIWRDSSKGGGCEFISLGGDEKRKCKMYLGDNLSALGISDSEFNNMKDPNDLIQLGFPKVEGLLSVALKEALKQ